MGRPAIPLSASEFAQRARALPGRYVKIGDRTVRKAIWISRADLLGEIESDQ